MEVKTLKMTVMMAIGALAAPAVAQSNGNQSMQDRARYVADPEAVSVVGYDLDGDGMSDLYLTTTRYEIDRLRAQADAQRGSGASRSTGTNYQYDGLNDRRAYRENDRQDRRAQSQGERDYHYSSTSPQDTRQGSVHNTRNQRGNWDRYDFGRPDEYYRNYGMPYHGHFNNNSARDDRMYRPRQNPGQQAMNASKGRTIKGTVKEMRRFSVSGQDEKQTFARVKTEGGQDVIIGLGGVSALKALDLSEGDRLTARVNRGTVNNRQVLFANRIKLKGQEQAIKHRRVEDLTRITGKVVATRTQTLQNRDGESAKHVLATVRNRNGQTRTVCLGQPDKIGMDTVQEGDEVSVLAKPVNVNGRHLYVAKRISVDGDIVSLSQAGHG